MENCIWIYAEHQGEKIAESFYELLTKAQEVAKTLTGDTKIAAVILGEAMETSVDELKVSGVDTVYAVKHEKLASYHPGYYPAVFAALARKYDPAMIWIAASYEGAEIAPSVAAKLKTGLAAHCVDILANEQGELIHMVPAFGGKVLSEILIPKCRPMMASVKPGIFRKGDITVAGDAEVIWKTAEELDAMSSPIKRVGREAIPPIGKAVEKADVVVAGGIGVVDMDNWNKAKEFAHLIGAAVGYTRPMIDIDLEKTEDNMIGASGKSVRPKLYLAFGISGASHHVCGMKDSGLIISVNRDESAEIFSVSDYKAVADCRGVLDALLRKIKQQ